MELTRKFTGGDATLRRLGHWAAGTRAIGAHLARAARLLAHAPGARAGSEPAETSGRAISSAKLLHDRSSIDRLAAGIRNAIIARLPGVVRASRSASSSLIDHRSGTKPADVAARDRNPESGAVNRSNPNAASGPSEDVSARDRMHARVRRLLGAFTSNRPGLGGIAGLRRPTESVGTSISESAAAMAPASHDVSRADREPIPNAIPRFTAPLNHGTLERAVTKLRTTEVANQLFRSSGSSVASPGVIGDARPDREERARSSDERDYPSRALTRTPSLATPLVDSSRRAQPAHLVSVPSGIASLSGFDTRLAAPNRIASAPIPPFPTAMDGGNDRTLGNAATVFTGPKVVINSSPTIVIHEAHGADIEGRVLGALRQHGGELYDQWQREVGRRQRTEF